MENSSRIIGGILILCLAIFLFSAPFDGFMPKGEEVFFEDVSYGIWSGVSEKLELKITDLETWEGLWAEMESICDPVSPSPIINFSTNVLFVVFQGERATSGYMTTITRIVLTTTGYVVFIDEIHPGPNCGTLQVLTQPHHIVVAPSSSLNLPVQFVYNITAHDCDSWV